MPPLSFWRKFDPGLTVERQGRYFSAKARSIT